MKLCGIYQKRLMWAEDTGRALPPWLQQHLAICPECRRFVAEQRRLADALRASAAHAITAPPPFLQTRIVSALRAETNPRTPSRATWRWGISSLLPLCGLLAVTVFLVNRTFHPPLAPTKLDTAHISLAPWNGQMASTQLVALAEQVHQPLEVELNSVLSDAKNACASLAGNFLPDPLAASPGPQR